MDHQKPQSPLTTEVESRVIASILGEASEYEQSQLETLRAEDPAADRFAEAARRTHRWLLSSALLNSLERVSGSNLPSKEADRIIDSLKWISNQLYQLRSKKDDSSDLRLSDSRRREILRLVEMNSQEKQQQSSQRASAAKSLRAPSRFWMMQVGVFLSRAVGRLRGWTRDLTTRQMVAVGTGLSGLVLAFLIFRASSPDMMLSQTMDRAPASQRWYQWGVEGGIDSRAAPSAAAPDDMMEFDFESVEMEESAAFGVSDAPVSLSVDPEPVIAANSQPPTSRLSLVAPNEKARQFSADLAKSESATASPESADALLGIEMEQMDMGGMQMEMGMAGPAEGTKMQLDDSRTQSADPTLPLPPSGGDAGFGEVVESQRLAERSKALEFPSLAPPVDRADPVDALTDAESNRYFFRDYSDNGVATATPRSQTRRSVRGREMESAPSAGNSVDFYGGTNVASGKDLSFGFGGRGAGNPIAGDGASPEGVDRFESAEGRMLGESDSGISALDAGGTELGFSGAQSDAGMVGGGIGGGGFGGGMGGMGQPNAAAATPRYSIPSQQLEDQSGNEAKLGLLDKSLEQTRETRRSLSDESRQRVAGRAGVSRGAVPTAPMRGESLNAPTPSNRGQQAQQQGQIDLDADGIVESRSGANLGDLFADVDKQLPQSGAVAIDALNRELANGATDKESEIGDASGREGEFAKAKKDQAVTGQQLQRGTSKGKQLEIDSESLFEREVEADEFALRSTLQYRSDSKESNDARSGRPNNAVTWQFRQEKIEEVFKELNAQQEPFSTFSLHVSDVSFKLARDAFAKGQWPDATRVRIEEFVNAIDYGDPMPTQRERIACQIEQAIHPALQQRNLVRIAMRTAATGRSISTPLRLTFLLDHSGSMERRDRRRTVQRVFQVLAGQLQPQDQVTLISFSSQPRLIADRLPGLQAAEVLSLIEQLPSEGGTNLEEALRLAGEKAREQFTEGAQNRVILVTDGAVNLGDANPSSLRQMILSMRDSGIAFDAAGIAADGLNDEILEALTRQGDGRYYLLDSQESVEDGFAKQIAGALRPAAKNVKVQVEFNSQRVGMYKLLGFEKHRLKTEDFRNDAVDAAEMAAAEAGVAVYQVQVKPDGVGDIGTVAIRFQDLSSGRMVEERWPITYDASTPRLEGSAVSMKLAGVASLFAMKLKGDERASTIDLGYLREVMNTLPPEKLEAAQVNGLKRMLDQAWQMGEVPPLP